jgi:SAM-dependent methyltransferase
MMTDTIDMSKLEAFMGQMIGYMTGGAMCYGMWLGDELGLYRALTDSGPTSADELAGAAGCHPRLVREWLDGQVAGGLIEWNAAADTYAITPEAAMALADEDSPAFIARAMSVFGSMYIDMPKIAGAFRGDGGLSWGDHHPCLFSGTEWFFRTGYRAELPGWLDALEGVSDKLAAGGTVADVGCGHGASAVVLADKFPEAHITGFDFHAPSIEVARQRAGEAGVEQRTSFEVADAKGYEGTYDLICFFDCLHDHGRPGRHRGLRTRPSRRGRNRAARRAVRARRSPRQHRRQPCGGAAVHGLVGDLHAELAVAGGGPRARGAGR